MALDFLSAGVTNPISWAFGLINGPWEGSIFKKETWESLMNGLRVTLTFGTALLILYEVRAKRLGENYSERTKRRIGIFLTTLGFLVYYDGFNANVRYDQYYHRHEFFHYYLGAKYDRELGYHRLYECALIAEGEFSPRGKAAITGREIRDLRVDLIKPVKDTYVLSDPNECKKHFTPEAWAAFKKDVSWVESVARGSYWENMLKDHGYNPPPVWTMDGKFFASFGTLSHEFCLALAAIDIALQLGCVLLIGWAFGWRIMTVATVFWGCNAPANFYWTGGAFMRMDYIFFLVAAVCLARKRRFGLAGAALTWSSLLRVFPVILFFGWGVMILIHLIRHRAFHPDHKRLIAGCAVAAGVLIPASIAVTGVDAYKEFAHHISVHKRTPLTNTMGLETVLEHDWEGRMRFTRDDNLDDPFEGWKNGRLGRFTKMKPVFLAVTGFVALWTVWALRRTKLLWAAVPMGLLLLMCLTNLTCYYYNVCMIAAALALQRPGIAPVMLVVSGASQILLRHYYWVDDKYTAQSYLWLLLGALILYSYSRPFSMQRLRAWLAGKPEPHDPPKLETAPAE